MTMSKPRGSPTSRARGGRRWRTPWTRPRPWMTCWRPGPPPERREPPGPEPPGSGPGTGAGSRWRARQREVPVRDQCPERRDQRKGLVQHDVVPRGGDLDHRDMVPEPVVLYVAELLFLDAVFST